jgi:hypothetical protein
MGNVLGAPTFSECVSGLACARRLALSRRRIRILLLEGRDRFGGRSLTVPCLGGSRVDLGGQWIGPNQPLVLELVQAMGLGTQLVRQTWFEEEGHSSEEGGGGRDGGGGLIAGASSLTPEELPVFDKLVAHVSERARGVRGPPLEEVWTFEGSIERQALKSPHIVGLFCPYSRSLLRLVWSAQRHCPR